MRYILGSRSPRRRELLGRILTPERIEVMPPSSAAEPGFEKLDDWPGIEARLLGIARSKCDDVLDRLAQRQSSAPEDERGVVITADTIIVAGDAAGRLVVLGQPPDDDTWAETVRRWFGEFYAGRTHVAATALCVCVWEASRSSRAQSFSQGETQTSAERLVKSNVTFHSDCRRWLDWYIATGEPRGKAGGYAIQGAGSLFVSRVEGSLSNVVGLPLRELWELLEELGVAVA